LFYIYALLAEQYFHNFVYQHMEETCAIIGSGVAGLATAIRLATRGYKVSIFEKESTAGGKISSLRLNDYRFDTGPSLLTMPGLIDELFLLAGENPGEHFNTQALDLSCKYFWEDGMILHAWQDVNRLASEIETKTGVKKSTVKNYLAYCRRLYELSGESFLFHSLHKARNYFLPPFRKTLLNAFSLDAFTSMHNRNNKWFSHPKLVQLFDRYATYNGSSPYKTPATLNMIAHLEHNTGACFPEKGMYSIVEALSGLASRLGVQFFFNSPVEKILMQGNKASGVRVNGETISCNMVISDVDIVPLYRDLLPEEKIPGNQLKQQRSTSALVFYWAIDRSFPELELHNILFSHNYEKEFECLFDSKSFSDDPSVYIFISSKKVKDDAPAGGENWYVMINAPENVGQDWDAMIRAARRNIINKINRILHTDITQHIKAEAMADPRSIEQTTGSFHGSLYGLSSNGMLAAFKRHPNFRRRFKNLYFTGGSVHPGGGIPLCLASAKIVDGLIK
jgi:phytoene desaturase